VNAQQRLNRESRNKDAYLKAKAAFNEGDLDRCMTFYAPDHQIMSKPTPKGRDHIRSFLSGSRASWPDIQIIAEHVLAEGDLVMGRCVTTATHTVDAMGIPATGKRVTTTFWDLHRFDDEGRIEQTWNLMDSLSVMLQLGVKPEK